MDTPSYQQLLAENQQLRERNARLEQTVRELLTRIDELERSAKRQAAPFSKGQPKQNPKKPGRKSGDKHGPHAHRESPSPARVDETLDAALPDHCPHCGGDLHENVNQVLMDIIHYCREDPVLLEELRPQLFELAQLLSQ